MAQRRMFSLRITNSSKFLKMPLTSQCLYFHLALNADDDGVVEAYNILKISGCNEDDLRVLASKKFVYILNDDLVTFIMDWNDHNLIRADRKIDSRYKNLLIQVIPDIKLLECKTRSDATKEVRKDTMNQSDLPYSFSYKIRQYFFGKKCPLCGVTMAHTPYGSKDYFPSIQHNTPLSSGGKHELGNISVICKHCNVTKQNIPTEKLNADEVVDAWISIIGQSKDCPMPAQVRLELGKDREYIPQLAVARKSKKELDPCFEELWLRYPKRYGTNSKEAAYRAYRARKEEKAGEEELSKGVDNYRSYCASESFIGTKWVMQGSKFFGRDKHYLQYQEKQKERDLADAIIERLGIKD